MSHYSPSSTRLQRFRTLAVQSALAVLVCLGVLMPNAAGASVVEAAQVSARAELAAELADGPVRQLIIEGTVEAPFQHTPPYGVKDASSEEEEEEEERDDDVATDDLFTGGAELLAPPAILTSQDSEGSKPNLVRFRRDARGPPAR